MQYAFISDIHANRQAWNAVLLDIRSQGIDRIICLGDIVGYGPRPAEVLESVHRNVDYLLLGNHDAVVCGKLDPSLFNQAAQDVLRWTGERINRQARRFLGSLPLSLDGKGFRCVHGDFSAPAAFNYVIDAPDALPSWDEVPHQLLLVGHTHQPAIFLLGASGTPHKVGPQDFELEDGKRYLVSVGSVGQPRDKDARSCYCVFDAATRALTWRRVPFDLDAYRADLRAAGLPPTDNYFLRHDPRDTAPPLRRILNFSPPQSVAQRARDTVEVAELHTLRGRVRTWRLLSALCAAGGIALASAVAVTWWRYAHRAREMSARDAAPIVASAVPPGRNLLAMPGAPVAAGNPVPGWSLRLGNGRTQAVRVIMDAGAPVFVLTSPTAREEILLASPPVHVTPGMRLTLEMLSRKMPGCDGSLSVEISAATSGDGDSTAAPFLVKQPNLRRQGGWLKAQQTFEVPAGTRSIRYRVRCRFAGEARLQALSLQRRDRSRT